MHPNRRAIAVLTLRWKTSRVKIGTVVASEVAQHKWVIGAPIPPATARGLQNHIRTSIRSRKIHDRKRRTRIRTRKKKAWERKPQTKGRNANTRRNWHTMWIMKHIVRWSNTHHDIYTRWVNPQMRRASRYYAALRALSTHQRAGSLTERTNKLTNP